MDLQEQINEPIANELSTFIKLFDQVLDSANETMKGVYAHLLQSKGKMMRPTLILLLAKGLSRITKQSYRAALALELLHTASLIHDDIVDNSKERRGQQSVNALYGNKVAVLSGDYMLAQALEIAAASNDRHIIQSISTLGKALADGELIQLNNNAADDYNEKRYIEIITKKTASLFSTCTKCAAYTARADSKTIIAAEEFGQCIGLAFQIKDDIFDYSSSVDIGKPTGNDMKEGRLTLPALRVLNTNNDPKLHEIARKVREKTATDEEIATLVDASVNGGGIDYAMKLIRTYVDKAKSLLYMVPNTEIRTTLHLYTDYVVNRQR